MADPFRDNQSYHQQNLPGVCPICGGASNSLPSGMQLVCPECSRAAASILGFGLEVPEGVGLGLPTMLDTIFAPDAAARLRVAGLGWRRHKQRKECAE